MNTRTVVVAPRQTGKVLAMEKFGVQIALEGLAEARAQWNKAKREFDADVNKVMRRLLHEASATYMSPEEVAQHSGYKVAQIRSMMRLNGLDPRNGKRVLADTAAKALAENASLLGIPVHEMDLTSPLAYLPMGSELRKALQDRSVSQVHELPEDSYKTAKDKIEASLLMGIDTDSIPIARSNVREIAAWLAGEGFVSGNASDADK